MTGTICSKNEEHKLNIHSHKIHASFNKPPDTFDIILVKKINITKVKRKQHFCSKILFWISETDKIILVFINISDTSVQKSYFRFSFYRDLPLTYILFIQSVLFLIAQPKKWSINFQKNWLELFSGQFLTRKLVELLLDNTIYFNISLWA